MHNAPSAELVAEYERDGVLFPLPALDPDEVADYREAFEVLERRLGGRIEPDEGDATSASFRLGP